MCFWRNCMSRLKGVVKATLFGFIRKRSRIVCERLFSCLHLQIQLMYKLWTAYRCRFLFYSKPLLSWQDFLTPHISQHEKISASYCHRIKQVDSISLKSCSQFCLIHPWCTSTNFQISTKMNGKETCELNMHGVIDENNDHFHDQDGVIFSLMLKVNIAYTRGKMSSRFADVTGITASTYKLMDHTWTAPFRVRVFHTKTTHLKEVKH